MRAVPVRQPRRTNIEPNARALAQPEQNTNISAADEKPNLAGMYSVQLFPGTCATKIISIASPRKKSSRRSRTRAAGIGRPLNGRRQRRLALTEEGCGNWRATEISNGSRVHGRKLQEPRILARQGRSHALASELSYVRVDECEPASLLDRQVVNLPWREIKQAGAGMIFEGGRMVASGCGESRGENRKTLGHVFLLKDFWSMPLWRRAGSASRSENGNIRWLATR